MIDNRTLDLAAIGRSIQPLIDAIPGRLRNLSINDSLSAMVHTDANVSEFPADQIWDTNTSPTWVTDMNIHGITVTVFAKGDPYTEEDES